MYKTALGARDVKTQKIIFKNEAHEKFFFEKINESKCSDVYHRAFYYCIGLDDVTRRNVDRIYDYRIGSIKTKCLHESWQTNSSKKVLRLAFSLYCSGIPSDIDYAEAQEKIDECRQYAPDKIFSCEYAPYFWQAIQLRYPEYIT